MSLGVCITTRHRPLILEQCLRHLSQSTLTPAFTVVSDDSTQPEMLSETSRVVAAFPDVKYVLGPRKGVCANRNHALAHLGGVDYVAYLDDDALVTPSYLAVAQSRFDDMPRAQRERTILTGSRLDVRNSRVETTFKLDFLCRFRSSEKPEVAGASYAVYPRSFFDRHLWDEQIFFGLEDAELSLRALHDGYDIVHADDMVVADAAYGQSTVFDMMSGPVTGYAFLGEAARLYVGVKRYKEIEGNYAKLAAFVPLFLGQITWSLAKRRSLHRLPELVRRSSVMSLFLRP